MEKGLIVVVSGPAGSGKGTVNKHLIETGDYVFSVSATTRAPRPGEVDGVNYHFLTKKEFRNRRWHKGFLENARYSGNFYGTPKKEALEVIESGKNLLLEIEVKGAMKIKKAYPDAVLIMLLPPSYEVQEARLRGRGTETEENILKRLKTAKKEVRQVRKYDYVVYNEDGGDLQCAKDIETIIRAEKMATERDTDIVKNFFEKKK